jgi:hypothetical protein
MVVYAIEFSVVTSNGSGKSEDTMLLDGCGAFTSAADAMEECVKMAQDDIRSYLEDDELDPDDEPNWPKVNIDENHSTVCFDYHSKKSKFGFDRTITYRVLGLEVH